MLRMHYLIYKVWQQIEIFAKVVKQNSRKKQTVGKEQIVVTSLVDLLFLLFLLLLLTISLSLATK